MLYKIQNFGPSKDVMVNGVKFFLGKNQKIDTDNAQFAMEATKLHNVDVEELFEKINYFELRKIAQEDYGIEIKGNIKKKELIRLIKQNNS
jgi:hypothetical protein